MDGVQKTIWTPPHRLAPAADDADDWPLCKICGDNPVWPEKESSICSRECLAKMELMPLRPVSGGVDGEAARDALIHSRVVKWGRDCSYEVVEDGVVQGKLHYGIGPDWTHCYCKKYQRPETVGTLIDSSSGEPSPGWVLYVEAEDRDGHVSIC